jgi:hypothetical protein
MSCGRSPSSDAPHWPQNLFSGGLAAPHDKHPEASDAPHWPQNLMSAGLSAWHREHLMPVAPGCCVDAEVEGNASLQSGQVYQGFEPDADAPPKLRSMVSNRQNFSSSVTHLTLPLGTR